MTAKIGGLGTQCSSLIVSPRSKSRESFKDIVRDEMDELEGFQQQELSKVKHMVRIFVLEATSSDD